MSNVNTVIIIFEESLERQCEVVARAFPLVVVLVVTDVLASSEPTDILFFSILFRIHQEF